MNDEAWMEEALKAADQAEALGEVPIGAVIVKDGMCIASGYNLRETTQQAEAHAEMAAIQKACEVTGFWRLEGCTLYVTLEPCPMCAGAIIQSRIDRVVFGAYDPKAGCAGTLFNLLEDEQFNHQAEVAGGVLEHECGERLSAFFRELRKKRKNKQS
ncbi:tRNA-adenosine deaminase [Salsuginibacillus halophilus]|uniref:tRNA-specific adenosine deaminase n=1 Tax=Salsuginibacillus halophilus TaxID=517424 RepID=A0A2P8HIB4_9BACI|nr:tRNA adenosine(34) deaminase TadA [Salsuginibacillus halophilus]PSL45963.1 tRNA-adenosine deaminase [Salsuginibacillus halophilus]